MRKILVLTGLCAWAAYFAACEKEERKNDSLQIAFEVKNASAYNANDGAISLMLENGEADPSFFWSTGQTTRDISGLYAGNYKVRIIYGRNGSSYFEGNATVSQPDPEPLNITYEVNDAHTYGRPFGSISVEIEGGTPPYSFSWDFGATSKDIEGLMAGTYTVRVRDSGNPYYIETEKTITVSQPDFVCGRDSVPDIDGNYYPTVQIGNQCWLADNLRTIHRPDSPEGELIRIDGRFCQGTFCEQKEGAHYTWHAMMNGAPAATAPDDKVQGICPAGWHLPTRAMYNELEQWLSVNGQGGEGVFAGTKMKGLESLSGFDAVYTGNWGYGIYHRAPQASFWSSTQHGSNPNAALLIYLTDDTPFVNSAQREKVFGLNVRCIKDENMP